MIFPLYFGEIQELKLIIVAIILFYFTLLNSMKINIATVLEIFTEKEKNRNLAMDLNKILLDLQEKKIQIQDLQQKQIQSNKMVALGEMAGGIAHEINTPLMSIKLLVSHIKNMLQKTPVLPDKIEKATSNIDSITDKIANIINGLRSFARDSQQDTFQKAKGRKLNSVEVHDLVCKIAESVVVGGVRRSALISLSNLTDERMRNAKNGQWWEYNKHRALANNSVAYTELPDVGIFMDEWKSLYDSKSGERGIFNRRAAKLQAEKTQRRDSSFDFGTNPCGEIILRPNGFCNLSEVVDYT
jgi:hypothetical protein